MPIKFDDIPKVATGVLNDDYQTSGYVFKAKQKTNYSGAVINTQVDFFQDKNVSTPAKLGWKVPSPFGLDKITIDKLEIDKGGKYKLEASADKVHDGVKLEAKSDLADLNKVVVACTYTGVKDAQFKFETKATKPQDFNGEVTYAAKQATVGMKLNSGILSGGLPDFGVRYALGPLFCSLLAKEKFGTFNAALCYTANQDLKCAATYQHGGKGSGNFAVGGVYKGIYKVKCTQDQTISCSAKHTLSKGFTLLGGASYNMKKANPSFGLQLSIE